LLLQIEARIHNKPDVGLFNEMS